jgi:hypothetical protein
MNKLTDWTDGGCPPSHGLVPRGRPPRDVDRALWDALVAVGRANRERVQGQAKLDAAVQAAVDAARARKATWAEIAEELGLDSRQAAQRKYGRGR